MHSFEKPRRKRNRASIANTLKKKREESGWPIVFLSSSLFKPECAGVASPNFFPHPPTNQSKNSEMKKCPLYPDYKLLHSKLPSPSPSQKEYFITITPPFPFQKISQKELSNSISYFHSYPGVERDRRQSPYSYFVTFFHKHASHMPWLRFATSCFVSGHGLPSRICSASGQILSTGPLPGDGCATQWLHEWSV